MTNGVETLRKVTYREAVREAIREAMQKDGRVFLMGEDVGHYGGCFAVSKGLLEEFGPERIRDTPLSESGFVGAGIGAALGEGTKDVLEILSKAGFLGRWYANAGTVETIMVLWGVRP